ncbi:MAG: 2-C-methyl-D-erythritol 2,4-cyclodiphosphate synthase [Acetobacter sp.]|nr:2-C-methyl-D-erythritol 2,4-cyclodiphosphate synthase [Acetobacter sp.]
MRVAAILLAAGTGSRYTASTGSKTPKQYVTLAGQPVIRHAAQALLPYVTCLQPVGQPDSLAEALKGLSVLPPVKGGETRQASVRAGLEALDCLPLEKKPDIVLVHDGARPYVPAYVIKNVIKGLKHYSGAIPAVAVTETLKRGKNGVIESTISRENLMRAQTPQGFHFKVFLDLHRSATALTATDDACLLEEAGLQVALVEGDDNNIKLTYERDLVRLEQIMGASFLPRIGFGYDVHAFEEGRPLILCGVPVAHNKVLAGHSDADVGIHALCDAIYGALAEGDIGRHFPPSQDEWRNADSTRFLLHAAQRITERGGKLVNVDLTFVCERPKIGPYVQVMRERLAELLKVDGGAISVKATTTERLGFTGREEGIACAATVSLVMYPCHREEGS